jgi:hypothetical protein
VLEQIVELREWSLLQAKVSSETWRKIHTRVITRMIEERTAFILFSMQKAVKKKDDRMRSLELRERVSRKREGQYHNVGFVSAKKQQQYNTIQSDVPAVLTGLERMEKDIRLAVYCP